MPVLVNNRGRDRGRDRPVQFLTLFCDLRVHFLLRKVEGTAVTSRHSRGASEPCGPGSSVSPEARLVLLRAEKAVARREEARPPALEASSLSDLLELQAASCPLGLPALSALQQQEC